jgi:hypothetical protein
MRAIRCEYWKLELMSSEYLDPGTLYKKNPPSKRRRMKALEFLGIRINNF